MRPTCWKQLVQTGAVVSTFHVHCSTVRYRSPLLEFRKRFVTVLLFPVSKIPKIFRIETFQSERVVESGFAYKL